MDARINVTALIDDLTKAKTALNENRTGDAQVELGYIIDRLRQVINVSKKVA